MSVANPRTPANPCAAPSGGNRWPGSLMSLMTHLVYGGIVGLVYRPSRA
jgi:hypothetical protein